jgi:hypothetical protein
MALKAAKDKGEKTFVVSGKTYNVKEDVGLDEGTWALPRTPKEKAALKKLLSKPLKAKDASDKLYDIIGDDELADDVDDFADNNPNDDVRPIVKGHMKRLGIKEDTDLDEASKEGTVKIIKTKDGKFQIQKMTKGKFVDMGKPYNSQKEAEKFRSGQPDLFGEASARADAMKAMRKGKSVDPADVDNIATDDDVKAASKNIMMQLRKAVSLRSYDVEFADGKQKVNQKIAQAVQNKYNTMRRPADKEKYQNFIAKSYKNMLQSLKAGYHEQKESVLDKVGKIIREKKNG